MYANSFEHILIVRLRHVREFTSALYPPFHGISVRAFHPSSYIVNLRTLAALAAPSRITFSSRFAQHRSLPRGRVDACMVAYCPAHCIPLRSYIRPLCYK